MFLMDRMTSRISEARRKRPVMVVRLFASVRPSSMNIRTSFAIATNPQKLLSKLCAVVAFNGAPAVAVTQNTR